MLRVPWAVWLLVVSVGVSRATQGERSAKVAPRTRDLACQTLLAGKGPLFDDPEKREKPPLAHLRIANLVIPEANDCTADTSGGDEGQSGRRLRLSP
jgi:hypothetical protein